MIRNILAAGALLIAAVPAFAQTPAPTPQQPPLPPAIAPLADSYARLARNADSFGLAAQDMASNMKTMHDQLVEAIQKVQAANDQVARDQTELAAKDKEIAALKAPHGSQSPPGRR